MGWHHYPDDGESPTLCEFVEWYDGALFACQLERGHEGEHRSDVLEWAKANGQRLPLPSDTPDPKEVR